MSKKEFIDSLFKKRSDYKYPEQAEDAAEQLETISKDIYSESQRFIFELIQNSDDASDVNNNEVCFDFYPNCLVVSHNGKPFTAEDIEAITRSGKSTKKADSTKTGYKGIGFKSVFGKSNRVFIFSNGYQFRFDKSYHKGKLPWQVIPIWSEVEDLPHEVKDSSLLGKTKVSTIIQIDEAAALKADLEDLLNNGQILLFLRRISKISVSVNNKQLYAIEKEITGLEGAYNSITLHKNGKEISSWIVKSFENITIPLETKKALKQDEKTPEKLKEAELTEISFAAKVDHGKIVELKGEDSLIFTFLPTKVKEFEFPFLINGSFITNAPREAIHEDRIWNQWLFELIAEKTFEWLALLATSSFKLQILKILPGKYSSQQNDLKLAFNKSYDKVSRVTQFIPNRDFDLKKASDLVIDRTGLSDEKFIPVEALIKFINKTTNNQFDNHAFIHPRIEGKSKLSIIGTTIFDIDKLEAFFLDESFKKTHEPEQNINLISYFFEKAHRSDSREWNEKLKSIPFIFAKGKKLKSPTSVCFPSVDYQTEFGEGVSVIHSKVYAKIEADSKIKSWLEQLGVKEPSDIAYLENEIIPNIDECIDESNYLKITRFLFDLHKKGLLEEWHYEKLNAFNIYTKSKEFTPASKCYFSSQYTPTLNLEGKVTGLPYISIKYILQGDFPSEWKTFFLKLGVVDEIKSIIENDYCYYDPKYTKYEIRWEWFNLHRSFKKPYHDGRVFTNTFNEYRFNTLTLIELTTNYTFSEIFWDYTFKKIKYIPADKVLGFWSNNWGQPFSHITDHGDYVIWLLENKPIIPTQNKICLKASDVFINDREIKLVVGKYLPILNIDEPLSDEWRRLLPLKNKLELEDYLTVLEKMAEEADYYDGEIRPSDLKRIGLIYNKLASELADFSKTKKDKISIWAETNKLLSKKGKFELSKELKWVKIEGFAVASQHLNIIQIPENCDQSSGEFEELLNLFGVHIIDEFEPSFKDIKPEPSLKLKIKAVLPYLASVLEKKQYLDFDKEYERLKSKIHNSEFYNVSEIRLSFIYQSNSIEGPSLNAYTNDVKLFFTGRWKSPITMFSLIPELVNLLGVRSVNDELRLLLESEDSESEQWLTQMGVDVEKLPKPEPTENILQELESLNSSVLERERLTDIGKLLTSKNITLDQLIKLIENIDADEDESGITLSTTTHLSQQGKNEGNEIARKLVHERLSKEGFEFAEGIGRSSVVNGVSKNGVDYPLVVKSYKDDRNRFNIRPNEWLQLSKPNSMFWVHRGNGKLEVLNLEGLLRANSDFHVQFETSTFSFDGLVKFAEAFRFVRNVHFQLSAPNFSFADSFDSYGFNTRKTNMEAIGGDAQESLH